MWDSGVKGPAPSLCPKWFFQIHTPETQQQAVRLDSAIVFMMGSMAQHRNRNGKCGHDRIQDGSWSMRWWHDSGTPNNTMSSWTHKSMCFTWIEATNIPVLPLPHWKCMQTFQLPSSSQMRFCNVGQDKKTATAKFLCCWQHWMSWHLLGQSGQCHQSHLSPLAS